MKFGKVERPEEIDFNLPEDHPETATVLSKYETKGVPDVFIGCAKWNRKDLKNFYPRGTKDELEYYGSQFNAIEMNATYYKIYDSEQIATWYDKVPKGFKFFPKVNRYISHLKWLSDIDQVTEDFYHSILHFEDKLGTTFLQLRGKFAPKFFDRVADFIHGWPDGVPLAIEFRHPDWYGDPKVAEELFDLLEENNIAPVLVDTAGRRDLMHMRLTNNEVFVRYVGANHPTDYTRLDEWVPRLKKWTDQGLQNIHFFVHQNDEQESPKLAAHFIQQLNRELGTNLKIPHFK